VIALAAIGVAAAAYGERPVAEAARPYPKNLLSLVRGAAAMLPGALPARINYIKFAESHRPLADIIEGGSQEDYVSARTAFQIMYPSGSSWSIPGWIRRCTGFSDSAVRSPTGPSETPPCSRRCGKQSSSSSRMSMVTTWRA
jgi:hypothetical protein